MNHHLRLTLLMLILLSSLVRTGDANAQEDDNLQEMPYVATQVATDIVVGTVLEIVESIDSGESGKSGHLPHFDTFYLVAVGTVVKGSASTGSEVQIRQQGGGGGSRSMCWVSRLASSVDEHPDGLAFYPEDESGFVFLCLHDESTAALSFNICTGISTNGIRLEPGVIEVNMRGFDEAEC